MEALGYPQVNEEVGNTEKMVTVGVNHWQGKSIKDILEEVDLFNLITSGDEDEQKLKNTDTSFIITEIKVIQ